MYRRSFRHHEIMPYACYSHGYGIDSGWLEDLMGSQDGEPCSDSCTPCCERMAHRRERFAVAEFVLIDAWHRHGKSDRVFVRPLFSGKRLRLRPSMLIAGDAMRGGYRHYFSNSASSARTSSLAAFVAALL